MNVLRYNAARDAVIVDSPTPRPTGKFSLAKTLATSISAGTEMGFYRGTAPQINSKSDSNGLFSPAPDTIRYPMQSDGPGVWWMGYSAVGRIEETGHDEHELHPGDLVWAGQGHKSFMVSDSFVKLPADIDPARATFIALLNITFNGMLDARVKLLDEVVIFGMGTLGQLLLQMCKLSGATVTAVDALPARLELARRMGADRIHNPTRDGDVGTAVQDLTRGRGADVIFEATGNVDALTPAVRCAGVDGTVTVMSFYQSGAASLYLGQEFHHKRISLQSSQVGRINPALGARYSMPRRMEAALQLVRALNLDPLISHRVAFPELPQALRMIDQSPSACQAVVVTY